MSGVMVCADCGANMVRKPVRSGEYTYAYYECQEYKSSKRRRCSCHSIREDKVEKIVLEAIRCQIDLVIRMDECMKHLDLTMLTELDRKRLERQKRVYEADIVKYGELVKKCYEDLYEGVISKDDYIAFKEEFELKKMAAHKGLAEVELEMRRVEDKTSVHYKWVEHFLEYKNVDELNRAMVLELVDSIVVKDKNHVEITMAFQDEFEVAYGELSALGEAAGEGRDCRRSCRKGVESVARKSRKETLYRTSRVITAEKGCIYKAGLYGRVSVESLEKMARDTVGTQMAFCGIMWERFPMFWRRGSMWMTI